MSSPVNGHLSPLTPATAEVAPNVQTDAQGVLQTLVQRCRSTRRVARGEPLYRRIDIRQHPYFRTSKHYKKLVMDHEEELALDLRITTDDIQAATILMHFAKRLLIYNEQTRSSSCMLECALTLSKDKRSEARCRWLETRRQPRPRLLRILQNWSAAEARFTLPPEWQRWKGVDVSWLVSCAPRRMEPSVPLPRAQQRAAYMAERLVAHARLHKMPDERDVCCPHCGMLPVPPITGPCGHTRCLWCAKNHANCPCGEASQQEMHVDTCVQYLIEKLLGKKLHAKVASTASERPPVNGHQRYGLVRTLHTIFVQEDCQALSRRCTVAQRLSRGLGVSLAISPDSFTAPDVPARLPMTPQVRLLHACKLLGRLRYMEAAAHLARTAASSKSEFARLLLIQTIAILVHERDPELVERELGAAVVAQSASAWLTVADLECVLCRDTLVTPVTTPCGHTYCRRCVEGSLDYRRACPLCLSDLSHFNLFLTQKSRFVCAALASINMRHSPPPLDPDVIPVFVCVTAFPKMSCPLLITLPRYRVLIRRMLQSGSRRLGMTALNKNHSYSDYGTILEVRDCVECDDGRMFLSTIGISRFKIVEKVGDESSGYARVEAVRDVAPSAAALRALRQLGGEVVTRARRWLRGLRPAVRANIEQTYGPMPPCADAEWWRGPDGPDWLWWLAVNLPLAPALKDLMITNCSLLTRLQMTMVALKQAMLRDSHQFC